MTDIVAKIQSVLDKGDVLTGDLASGRCSMFRPDLPVETRAIIRPTSTAEVAAVVGVCEAAGQPLVVHGGLTGLVGSEQTTVGELVLSLERMNRIEEIDTVDRTMTVQAGVPLQTLQDEAEKCGLMFPLDMGARGSCHIGGNVATNAGGNRVIRFGMTRDMILGLEVVLADGTVISTLNRMIKNNAGYDLKQLFIGTEGTLGIITRVVLRLRESPNSRNNALVAIESFDKLGTFLKFVDGALGGGLSAFEVMWDDFYKLVTTAPAPNKPPIEQGYPYYVLVESLGGERDRDQERFEQAMEGAFEEGLLVDAVIAKSGSEYESLWALRDSVDLLLGFQPLFAFDVGLPIGRMEAYVEKVRAGLAAEWEQHHCFVFGHLGDGNLHVIVSAGERDLATRSRVEEIVYHPLREFAGTISAEHGIGLEKKAYLDLSRSDDEIALMRRVKQALDPRGIFNPGKVFDT